MAVLAVFAWDFGNHVNRSDELSQLCSTHLDPSILSRSASPHSAGAVVSAIPVQGKFHRVGKEPQTEERLPGVVVNNAYMNCCFPIN